MTVLERFLKYVQVDTPSDPENDSVMPSNPQELNLANMLKDELLSLGITDAETDENGYVYASIPANCEGKKAIGLIAHLDVVNEPKGYGVKPCVHKNYAGGDIKLEHGEISEKDFPVLKKYLGQDIVTSDGTTILGADDKAGVAEIMTVAEYLMKNPQIKHGKIGIAFTPDEEIGNGASRFNVEKFGCDFAYTVDGEELGEICYETFNAASFDFTITGVNIHPGQAKGKMVNSVVIVHEILGMLPADERPENTEGREGFYFVNEICATVSEGRVSGIIRDHARDQFEERKEFVRKIAEKMEEKYPGKVRLVLHDQYYNCAEVIKPHYHLVENAVKAMEKEGVKPIMDPIRGGTDGSGLSFKGLPCPNVCTGGHNAHGKNEFIPVGSMEKTVKILLHIIDAYAR